MAIYVDEAVIPWRGQKWAHLMCSDIEELHAFAAKIGLKRSWFQDKRIPHYDVNTNKRRQAIAAGAIPVGWGEIPEDALRRADDGTYHGRAACKAYDAALKQTAEPRAVVDDTERSARFAAAGIPDTF